MQVIEQYFPNLTNTQIKRFDSLDQLYRLWNSRINVISRKDIDALYEHHVLHSLSIAKAFTFSTGMQIMDLGTGGGFPGIPLAILLPEVHFHLVDSVAKKIRVCDEIISALSLTNVTTQWTRAEHIQGHYDCVVSRAVASLPELMKWCKPLTQRLICLKGIDEVVASHNICITPISRWFSEEYFSTKAVISVTLR